MRQEFQDARAVTDVFERIRLLEEEMAECELYHDGISPARLAELFDMRAADYWNSTYVAVIKEGDIQRIMKKKGMSRAVIRQVMRDAEKYRRRLQKTQDYLPLEHTDRFIDRNINWINRTVRKKISGCVSLLEAVRAAKAIPDIITERYIDVVIMPYLTDSGADGPYLIQNAKFHRMEGA